MEQGKKKALMIFLGIGIFIAVISCCVLFKKIKINTFVAEQYSVQGIDVSHYQGDIDWEKLESQGIDFAYIKATEGSSSVDERFTENWSEAAVTSMKIGAYHFFSFDSAGETQAQNFMDAVGVLSGKLLPVVDVEYYGDKEKNPPEREAVIRELNDMLLELEREYGVKPMIYTTLTVYSKYLEGEFEDYPLWIRDVYLWPEITLKDKWVLWQYSDTSVLSGYQGTEKYIDRNVFAGNSEELEEITVP
ncbi:MAG: glycoside hydrolase family 25 protein [Lachnospiraceae bacterium]|nr:glycoside hydrolase family 25 protein [Lachnospiraceae bacterium]